LGDIDEPGVDNEIIIRCMAYRTSRPEAVEEARRIDRRFRRDLRAERIFDPSRS
jgi:hypothetical protein